MVGTDRPRPRPVCGTELRTALNRAEMVPPTWREEAGAGWGRFLTKASREPLSQGTVAGPRAGGHSAFLRFVGRAAKGPPAGQAKGMASLGVTDSGFAPVWPGRPCSSGLPPSGSARKGNHTGRFSDAFMTRKEDWAVQRGHGHPGRGSQGARLPWGASTWRGAQLAWRLLPEESAQRTPVAQQHEPTRKGAGSGRAPLPEALRLRSSGPAPKPGPRGACREGAAPAGNLCTGGAAG